MKCLFGFFLVLMVVIGFGGCAVSDLQYGDDFQELISDVIRNEDLQESNTTQEQIFTPDISELQETNKVPEKYFIEESETSYGHLRREGTYEYRGLIFDGIYFSSPNPHTQVMKETFYVSNDSLDKEPGLSLYNAAYEFATLFYINDTKGIKKYCDNEGDYKSVIDFGDMNELFEPRTLDEPSPLVPYNIIAYEDGFLFIFLYTAPDGSNPDIGIEMFLNDKNEWRIKFISYC